MSAEAVLIDTGLRLTVAGERYGVVRCSKAGASAYLVREDFMVMGRELGCEDCEAASDGPVETTHPVQLLDDAIGYGTVSLDEDGVSLGFAEIIATTTVSLRSQLRRKSSRRSSAA